MYLRKKSANTNTYEQKIRMAKLAGKNKFDSREEAEKGRSFVEGSGYAGACTNML